MVNNKNITSVLFAEARLIKGLCVVRNWCEFLIVECAYIIRIEFELYDHFRIEWKARVVILPNRNHTKFRLLVVRTSKVTDHGSELQTNDLVKG